MMPCGSFNDNMEMLELVTDSHVQRFLDLIRCVGREYAAHTSHCHYAAYHLCNIPPRLLL